MTPGTVLQRWSSLSELDRPRYLTFEQRMGRFPDAVRTWPVEWQGNLILVALRHRHLLDQEKLARTLGVEPWEIKPALPVRVRMKLGFEPGFETLVTDEQVARFIDVRVTRMRGATIATGTSYATATVIPDALIALTRAAVGDFATEPLPLDHPLGLYQSYLRQTPAVVKTVLEDVSNRVNFPIWAPADLLAGGDVFHLDGADWSSALGSPASELDRITLTLSMQPGHWTTYLDQSPSPAHNKQARQEWPRYTTPGADKPWMTNVLQVEREGVGITIVAHERFPESLQPIADSLVPFAAG